MSKRSTKVALPADDDQRLTDCKNGDIEARNSLVEECLPLVDQIVNSLMVRFPQHVEPGELRAFGAIGLIHAVQTFDPNKATLRTHLAFRVRCFIFDELRKADWAPKSFRARVKEVEKTETRLKEELDRQPTDAEIGEEVGKDASYVRQIRHEKRISWHKSLGELEDSSGDVFANVLPVTAGVETTSEVQEYLAQYVGWLGTLTAYRQTIWALRFYRHLSPLKIAKIFSVKPVEIHYELQQLLLDFDAVTDRIRQDGLA